MKRKNSPCIDVCQFSGKTVGVKAVVGPERRQENRDL